LGILFLSILISLGTSQQAFALILEEGTNGPDVLSVLDEADDVQVNAFAGDDEVEIKVIIGNVGVDPGIGNDMVIIDTITGDVTVVASDGEDEITVINVEGDVTVQGGPGDDIIFIDDVSGVVVVDGGGGNDECTVPQGAIVTNCGDEPHVPQVIGGKIIPIETTSLILAAAQSTSWLIPVVLSIAGIGLALIRRQN